MGELGEHRASLLSNPVPEAKTSGGSERGQNNGGLSNGNLGPQSASFESHWLQGSQATAGLAPEDTEEEIPQEEVVREELAEAPNPDDSHGRELEVEVVEMRWVLGTRRRTVLTHQSTLAIFIVLPLRVPSSPRGWGYCWYLSCSGFSNRW